MSDGPACGVPVQHPTPEWIASQTLILVERDGEERTVCLRIGRPYWDPRGNGACPVATEGWFRSEGHPICGENEYQALTLAVSYLHALLDNFVSDGGRILLGDRSETSPGLFAGASSKYVPK